MRWRISLRMSFFAFLNMFFCLFLCLTICRLPPMSFVSSSINLSVYLSIYLSVCLSVCLSIYQPASHKILISGYCVLSSSVNVRSAYLAQTLIKIIRNTIFNIEALYCICLYVYHRKNRTTV